MCLSLDLSTGRFFLDMIMASEMINRLRELMQQQNMQEDAVVQEQPVLVSALVSQQVLENKLEENNASSEDDYAVRKNVRETLKEQKRVSQTLPDLAKVVDIDEENRPVGQLAEAGIGFCPVLAAAKYPYKFLNESANIIEQVSSYFAAEKFWNRKWTM